MTNDNGIPDGSTDITEDDKKRAEDDIQKLTDNSIKDVDKVVAEKEKELMAV